MCAVSEQPDATPETRLPSRRSAGRGTDARADGVDRDGDRVGADGGGGGDPGSLRGIARLAVPALGALVAQPLFVLVDAAIVGTLGTLPLAGLGAAATIASLAVGLCVFLAYATTSSVARRVGELRWDAAVSEGVEGMALGLAISEAEPAMFPEYSVRENGAS